MSDSTRPRYNGNRQRLVLAFDVGTTHSCISYSVLDPGQVPQIKGVTRFPALELISGASKIPTIIYYDQDGKVRAVGAEATREGVFEEAEDGKWVKAEWFKLHLRSKIGAGKHITDQIPPLPLKKTVIEVFADFLSYLLECAASYIEDTHENGTVLWNSVKNDIDFVLSHPNGWDGKEQSQMRKAAVLAGLIPDTALGYARVFFVTEGEASLHFALQDYVLFSVVKKNEGIIVVDAREGTIDVSSYSCGVNAATKSYEEISPPQCFFHGSVFVTIQARFFLQTFLEGSPFIDDLDHIVRCFDLTTKKRFKDAGEPQYIKFGSTRDNDPAYNIRFGQLKLLGTDVAKFFEPSIDCIVSAVLRERDQSPRKTSHVVLVGIFAENDYLTNSVSTALQKIGLNLHHVYMPTTSDGAIVYYLDVFADRNITHEQFVPLIDTRKISTRCQYKGKRSRLVLAFDIGATYSGISYSVLNYGEIPQIKGVTRFPALEVISGGSKIPTLIYYDRNGDVRAVGAEAMREGILEQALDEQWVKAEWFKLHLRSNIGSGKNIAEYIPPLPLNKTVIEVFADFLGYLFRCAASYICETHENGSAFWNSVKDDINFILSHPNGWGEKEQTQMRKAAILAGLVTDTVKGHASRLSFIAEGVASLHFSIQNSGLSAAMKQDEAIIIVDAGGGTINVSSYSCGANAMTNAYEEIAPPQCHYHGSLFVSVRASDFLQVFLKESGFIDDLDHIVRCFDKETKTRFKDAGEPQYIKFGSNRDNDSRFNIRFGQLKLKGSDVAQFFGPSVRCIVSAVLTQSNNSHRKISRVVLVGGFAASDWLFDNICVSLQKFGLIAIRPESNLNKAVSDGAILFYLDHIPTDST